MLCDTGAPAVGGGRGGRSAGQGQTTQVCERAYASKAVRQCDDCNLNQLKLNLNLLRMAVYVPLQCRLLAATGNRDFQHLANKTFLPAVAGVTLPNDNQQVKALQDRVHKVRAWLLCLRCAHDSSTALVLVGLLAEQQSLQLWNDC